MPRDATPYPEIKMIEAYGLDADQGLATLTQCRLLPLFEQDFIVATMFPNHCCSHG